MASHGSQLHNGSSRQVMKIHKQLVNLC